MIQEMQIKNFALIDNLEISFGPGLTVLTGETGAGKSIIVDAVGLLVGARASTEYIRAGFEKTVVSGLFNIKNISSIEDILKELGIPNEADGTLLLSREICLNGRNSCRINGRNVTLSMYQQVGQMLVDIHGQHTYQSILRQAYQMEMLDSLAGLTQLREKTKELYYKWKNLQKKLDDAITKTKELENRRDLLEFQLKEITSAGLRPEEEKDLMTQREILNNAEKLAEGAATIIKLLFEGEDRVAYDLISMAVAELQEMASIDPDLTALVENLESVAVQVEEVFRSIRRYMDKLEYNPEMLKDIEARLDTIHNLKRKYGSTIEEILQYGKQVEASLKNIELASEEMEKLENEIKYVEAEYHKAARQLHEKRAAKAEELEIEITSALKKLAMPEARIIIDCQKSVQPGPNGIDNITFMFQPNPGEGKHPLSQIASGGEMARVVLALKNVLSEIDSVPTIVFDEIDAGIGGTTAKTVARTLYNIAQKRQVLCITHSAQLAGYANKHFRVSKTVSDGRTFTRMEEIRDEKRIEEIARLLSGDTSKAAKKHAKALLENI